MAEFIARMVWKATVSGHMLTATVPVVVADTVLWGCVGYTTMCNPILSNVEDKLTRVKELQR